jgi:sigma-B regulation protein RsbU (phosphoserine phosphatase)
MIGGLVAHERDLAAMTQALVESQDDLLGLVSMLGAARVDDGDLRTSLAHRARELMRSEGVAIVTPGDGGWRVDGSPQEAAHEAGSLIATASSLEEVGRALSAEWLVFDAPEHLDVPMLLAVRRSLSGPPTSPLMRLAASTAELCAALIGQAERHAEALERQRLARQLEFAGEVQRHLLQRTSARARGLRLATSYQPADAVGGDLYAVRNHGDETVLALGDVSGKGAPAALLMAAARALFESHSRTTTDPRELLALVARDLDEDLDRNGALLTFVIARYRASSGALSVANAGHAPVLLKTAAGVSLLEPTDPPLGVVSGGHFGQLELDLCAGDTLLLASDGLSEREAPDGRFFGIDRISRLVERSDGTPRRLVDGIRAAARRFAAGRPAADDETLVVVQARRGASA